MGSFLKKFETHSGYNTYITGQDVILPNVSYCEDNDDVHYNPVPETRLIVQYKVTDISNPTQITFYYNASYYSKIIIDGTEVSVSDINTNEGCYQFNKTGIHTVKYTLVDPSVIGFNAFYCCSNLISVIIPDSVTTIGESAFQDCSNLINVNFGNGVTSISQQAFTNCAKLTTINLPNSLITIGTSAFHGCVKLTDITLPNSITSIGNSAFNECLEIKNLTIPSNNITIGQEAFAYCYGLTNLSISGNGSVTINFNSFICCINLKTITFGNGNITIDYGAFSSCWSLETITLPSNITSIGQNAFYDCYFMLNNFINNTNLDEVSNNYWGATILDSDTDDICVKNNSLVKYRGNLNNVTIPNNITSIAQKAFMSNKILVSVTIPSSVTSIGFQAFEGCSNLASITSLATTAPTIDSYTFYMVKTGGTLYVPSGSTGYNTWMGTGNYYLGKYNWTKVEQ